MGRRKLDEHEKIARQAARKDLKQTKNNLVQDVTSNILSEIKTELDGVIEKSKRGRKAKTKTENNLNSDDNVQVIDFFSNNDVKDNRSNIMVQKNISNDPPIKQQKNNIPWIEKYRPTTVEDIILDDCLRVKLENLININALPNLIITGSPGTGKTSTMFCLARKMLGKKYNEALLELNASDNRGLEIINNSIIHFCKKKINGILDNSNDIVPSINNHHKSSSNNKYYPFGDEKSIGIINNKSDNTSDFLPVGSRSKGVSPPDVTKPSKSKTNSKKNIEGIPNNIGAPESIQIINDNTSKKDDIPHEEDKSLVFFQRLDAPHSEERPPNKTIHLQEDYTNLKKIIIFDEADNITRKAQNVLANMMEEYGNTTRFCFTCNDSTKIIESIQSRCLILHYRPMNRDNIKKRLIMICQSEKVNYEEKGIESIIFISQGDIRQAINNLEATHNSYNNITEDNVYKLCYQPHPNTVIALIQKCASRNLIQAIAKYDELKEQGYCNSDILQTMINVLKLINIDENIRINFIKILSDTYLGVSEGTDTNLQMYSCISKMINYITTLKIVQINNI